MLVKKFNSNLGREELRAIVKIANLYYKENLKQSEIAKRLNLSQVSVSRYLKRAQEENIVKITVNIPFGCYTDLENTICKRYGLKEVIVVDHSDDREQLLRNLGSGAAYYLNNTIKKNDFIGISCWSESLLATARAMNKFPQSISANVIQILGGLGNPESELHAYYLTRMFADLTNGESIILSSPGIVGNLEARNILLKDSYIRSAMDRFKDISLALVGIGALEPSRFLTSSGNVFSEHDLITICQANGVGDICLRFFDQEGSPIVSDLNDRVIGISLDQLRRIPQRLAVAGGENKHQAIHAAIRKKWINILITDEATARQIEKNISI